MENEYVRRVIEWENLSGGSLEKIIKGTTSEFLLSGVDGKQDGGFKVIFKKDEFLGSRKEGSKLKSIFFREPKYWPHKVKTYKTEIIFLGNPEDVEMIDNSIVESGATLLDASKINYANATLDTFSSFPNVEGADITLLSDSYKEDFNQISSFSAAEGISLNYDVKDFKNNAQLFLRTHLQIMGKPESVVSARKYAEGLLMRHYNNNLDSKIFFSYRNGQKLLTE